MAELKTKRNRKSVAKFLGAVEDPGRREDAQKILALMADVTGEKPEMWGNSIVGFGQARYTYESGRTGEWFVVGFSPRKSNLTLYILSGFSHYHDLMGRLGTYKTGKSCLYIRRLEDIDMKVLRRLVKDSVTHLREFDKEESDD